MFQQPVGTPFKRTNNSLGTRLSLLNIFKMIGESGHFTLSFLNVLKIILRQLKRVI